MSNVILDIKESHQEFFDCENIQYRIASLKKLKQVFIAHEDAILAALQADLNKSYKESYLCEFNEVLAEIDYHLKHCRHWAKNKRVKTSYQTFLSHSYIVKKPRGKVLIIVPFNYPINLSFIPLVGAISAGNKVLLKMSRNTPHVNAVVQKIIETAFDPRHVVYAQTNNYDDLYTYEPQMIFFTGSTKVGKQIESYCVNHNIHYLTEMGGSCPCMLYDVIDPQIYQRIVWAKFLNAGQTCVSINYLLYNKTIPDVISNLQQAITKQFPEPLKNKNIPKIINQQEFDRLVKIIKENQNHILYGGHYDEDTLIIEPTIIETTPEKIKTYGEIFGPLLFVIPMENDLDTYWQTINTIDATPLAAYLFSKQKSIYPTFMHRITAGGYAINDALIHLCNHHLPFGGEGTSGNGKYHGHYSFDAFSLINGAIINSSHHDIPLKFINNNFSYSKTKKLINFIKRWFL